MFSNLADYALNRMKEASTWRGIVVAATGFGIQINPDMIEPIVSVGLAIAGLIGVLFKDKK